MKRRCSGRWRWRMDVDLPGVGLTQPLRRRTAVPPHGRCTLGDPWAAERAHAQGSWRPGPGSGRFARVPMAVGNDIVILIEGRTGYSGSSPASADASHPRGGHGQLATARSRERARWHRHDLMLGGNRPSGGRAPRRGAFRSAHPPMSGSSPSCMMQPSCRLIGSRRASPPRGLAGRPRAGWLSGKACAILWLHDPESRARVCRSRRLLRDHDASNTQLSAQPLRSSRFASRGHFDIRQLRPRGGRLAGDWLRVDRAQRFLPAARSRRRGRMSNVPSCVPPSVLGAPTGRATVGRVATSWHDGIAASDLVLGYGGWQDFTLSDGFDPRRLESGSGSPSWRSACRAHGLARTSRHRGAEGRQGRWSPPRQAAQSAAR